MQQTTMAAKHSEALNHPSLLSRLFFFPKRVSELVGLVMSVAIGVFSAYKTYLLVSTSFSFSTSLLIAGASGWGALSVLWIISYVAIATLDAIR